MTAATVVGIARAQLQALSKALNIDERRQSLMHDTFEGIGAQCGDQMADQPPRWSGMSDDCSPIEWSVAFRRGPPDVRVLVEAQGEPPTLKSYAAASRRLTRWLVEHAGADETLVKLVQDAFPPVNDAALAAAYHGVEFLHGGAIRTKLYLNPAVAGDRWDTARRALVRIGLGPTVDAIRAAIGPMDLPMVAFDLEPVARARVKLYVRANSLEEYEQIGAMCASPCAGDFRPTTVAMYGEAAVARRPFLAIHLDASKTGVAVPPERAVYSLPVFEVGGEVGSSTYRIAHLLEHHGLDAQGFRRTIAALTQVSPPGLARDHRQFALPSWLSIQREPDGSPRITVYFRLRAFAAKYGWPSADDSPRTWPSPVLSRGSAP